jgi:hypothetical protein
MCWNRCIQVAVRTASAIGAEARGRRTGSVEELFGLEDGFHILHPLSIHPRQFQLSLDSSPTYPSKHVDNCRLILLDVTHPRTSEEPTPRSIVPSILIRDPQPFRLDRRYCLYAVHVNDGSVGLTVEGRRGGVLWVDVCEDSSDEVTEICQMKSFHRITCNKSVSIA